MILPISVPGQEPAKWQCKKGKKRLSGLAGKIAYDYHYRYRQLKEEEEEEKDKTDSDGDVDSENGAGGKTKGRVPKKKDMYIVTKHKWYSTASKAELNMELDFNSAIPAIPLNDIHRIIQCKIV